MCYTNKLALPCLAYTVGLYQALPERSLCLIASQVQARYTRLDWKWRWSDHSLSESHGSSPSQVFFNYVESSRKSSNLGPESSQVKSSQVKSSLESCDPYSEFVLCI